LLAGLLRGLAPLYKKYQSLKEYHIIIKYKYKLK